MAQICILCEKPSASKNYAKALGGMKGTFNGKTYEIVNSIGHLFNLAKPHEQVSPSLKDKYRSWDITNLPWDEKDFRWKLALQQDDFKTVYNDIVKAMEKADEIVIATDNDFSGEGTLLADEIILEAGLNKKKQFWRSFHIDESEKEILKAMNNLKDLGRDVTLDPDYQKANFRRKWDYLSQQETVVFTKLANNTLLREGRLKSFIKILIGNQQELIDNYKKVPFYQWRFKDENGVVYTDNDEPHYKSKEKLEIIYKDSEVVKDKTERKTTTPPLFYDLNMLSGTLAPKGYGAKLVLDTYQKMYNDQVVSYPRTDDKEISIEQFNEFLEIADSVADVLGVDKSLLSHRQPRKSHIATGMSHGANRPASNVPKSLQELENKYGKCGVAIYTTLALNTLAMLCEDYEYDHITGHIKDYPKFKGCVNVPVSLGFKTIFKDEEEEEETSAQDLGTVGKPFIHEGFPPKPASITAKWLAKQLEKYNVGTGATRTSVYAEMTNTNSKNNPLTENRGKITMTEYGKLSYKLLKGTRIGDVKLTESVYAQMEEVSKDFSKADMFLSQFRQIIIEDIANVTKNVKEHGIELPEKASSELLKHKCPKCSGTLKATKTGGLVCENYFAKTCDFGINRTIASKKISDGDIKDLLEYGKTEKIFGFKSKAGKSFNACLKLDEDYKTTFVFD